MGSVLSASPEIILQPRPFSPGTSEVDEDLDVLTAYSHLNQEKLLLRFEAISNAQELTAMEQKLPPFEFRFNYFYEMRGTEYVKVPLDYEDEEEARKRETVSPMIGKSQGSTWVYIGDILKTENVRDGRGFAVTLDEKGKFQGYFHNGEANGRGRYVTDKHVLEGEWADGHLEGDGIETILGHVIYTGQFHGSQYHGMGKAFYKDGSYYSGEFLQGEREGYGEYWWRSGAGYQGNWQHGKFHGFGKYVSNDGDSYEGNWSENKLQGYGEFEWSDGRKYKGNYQGDKKHGYGELYWPDGSVWRGRWVNGRQHGKGTYISSEGDMKEGYWHHGTFLSWNLL
jgi:hypothetical protein